MAVGKNKRISKGKKGSKKKVVDAFSRKEWYNIVAPAVFRNRDVGKTPVNRSVGTKLAADSLRGRVISVSLADLNNNESEAWRIIKLRVEDVQGKNCLTNFYGMDLTTDKLKLHVKKWQTLIEAHVDVKTLDGYTIRLFAIAFTKNVSPIKKTAYAKTSKVRLIRKRMMDIMTKEASSVDLKDLVKQFIPDTIAARIERECYGIYPLSNVFIRKAKIIKAPKLDTAKLADIHGDEGSKEDTGTKVDRT